MSHLKLTYPVPVTASWSARLPEGYARIGISRGPPRGQPAGYRMYRPLAPGPWFNSVPPEEFCRLYLAQLQRLEPEQVLKDLAELAGGKIPTLLCFEPPPPNTAWCHRGLVAGRLHDQLGIEIREVGHEHLGGGWMHPKLPPEWHCGET
jgi:Protein of unknown function, DUF488